MPRPEQPVARLVWVLDGEVRFDPHRGPNRLSADEMVRHVRSLEGAASEADEPLLTAVAMLAEAVDSDPTNAALWRQYRDALDAVKGLTSGDDDAFTRLMAELGGAEVRHTPEPEQADQGNSSRKGR